MKWLRRDDKGDVELTVGTCCTIRIAVVDRLV